MQIIHCITRKDAALRQFVLAGRHPFCQILVAAAFRVAAVRAMVMMVIFSAAAFVLVVMRVRVAAGILLFVLINGLAAIGRFGVLTAHK